MKKNKGAAKEAKASTNSPSVINSGSFDAGAIIKKPRITEKSGIKAESEGVYTFEITAVATKKTVAKAIKELYKVDAVKVNITKLPSKKVFAKGKKGSMSGVKKAVVFLKKGDKIAFI
ncbi:MAG: 50S ribosomal protein L23 [bacterium]